MIKMNDNNLTQEQLDIIEAPMHEKTLVMASAASGKTKILTERLKYLLNNGMDPKKIVCITFTNNAANEMKKRIPKEYQDCFIGTIHSYAYQLLAKNGIPTKDLVQEEEFDRLFERLVKNSHVLEEVEYLLCDESQDLDPHQYELLIYYIKPKGALFVGDEKQCQTGDTIITLENDVRLRLDEVKVGDKVKHYAPEMEKVEIGTIDEISSRTLEPNELLNRIVTHNDINNYTDNHRCYARINYSSYRNNIICLIRDKNGDYRIVRGSLRNRENKTLIEQIEHEELWILGAFEEEAEADLEMEKANDLLYISDGVVSVSSCLEHYGKNIALPLSSNRITSNIYGENFDEIHACNIVEDIMFMPIVLQGDRIGDSKVMSVDKIDGGQEKVYSLKVSPHGTYIANGIVTHNSIYGFRGSDPTLLKELEEDAKWEVRYLTNNFRNSIRINNFANEAIDRMEGFSKKKSVAVRKELGSINYYYYMNLAQLVEEEANGDFSGWAVLCRSNNQVQSVLRMLSNRRIPCITFKKADMDLDTLNTKSKSNAVKVLTIHSAKGLEFPNVILADKIQYANKQEDIRIFYVAITRAMDSLYLRK